MHGRLFVMSVGCIVQARMGSTRLPGKVLMKLDEHNTVLDYVIQQLKHCKNIDKIIVATTLLKQDDEIEKLTKNNDIVCFRGDSSNVLDRFYQCAKLHSLTTVIRITADNPLIDPIVVEKVIIQFKQKNYDYVTNTLVRSFPYGTEVEVFSFEALEEAWRSAKQDTEREHVTPYLYNNPEKFRIHNVMNDHDVSSLRWTVDQIEDLTLVRNIVSKITTRPIVTSEILNLLSKEPELITINKNVIHKHLDDF